MTDRAYVSVVVERVERVGGPLFETHHWHANVWVEGVQVADTWCFTRTVALNEAFAALERAGVEVAARV